MVMPNHFHGIVGLVAVKTTGTLVNVPAVETPGRASLREREKKLTQIYLFLSQFIM